MNELKAFLAENLAGFSFKSLPVFIFSFLVCVLLSYILSKVYVRYGHSVSNRTAFAKNFVLLAITTMFIISVVKSSLALSLGLVGALSIVRFRAAIKEPEELTYLFLTIAIGLGCGAGLTILTIIAFTGFLAVIFTLSRKESVESGQLIYVTISSTGAPVEAEKYIEALTPHCEGIKLKRMDHATTGSELNLLVDITDYKKIEAARVALQKLDPTVTVSFLDNSRDF